MCFWSRHLVNIVNFVILTVAGSNECRKGCLMCVFNIDNDWKCVCAGTTVGISWQVFVERCWCEWCAGKRSNFGLPAD